MVSTASESSSALGGTKMAVEYKEILCHKCKGTCEIEQVAGEYGYAPYYADCPVCKGDGYIRLYPDAVYNADRM